MDVALFRFINSTLKNPLFDLLMPVFSDKDLVILPGVVAAGLVVYFGRRHARTCMLALVLALVLADVGAVRLFKNAFERPRPYAALTDVHHHRSGQWHTFNPLLAGFYRRTSHSFPSAHAANIAAAAAVLAFLDRRTLRVMIPLAFLVGLSRIYTGNHYPFDVVAGYAWGTLCGVGAFVASRWLVSLRKTPETAPGPPPAPERRAFYWILGGWTLLNFVFLHLNIFDLAGDEAQYWDWSRRLALGYYSKPPLIAYVIDLLTGAAGNKEWAIRTGAVLFSSAAVAVVYALTLRIARNERAALLAALASIAMPFTWAGSVIMTIDPLLVFFWALVMYTFHRAVNDEERFWWLVGAALGFGMLAKYTMVLLAAGLGLYLLLVDRRWWRTRWPWLAVVVALVMQSGVIYWNWQHDWVSFRHTAAIGADEQVTAIESIGYFLEYLGGQFGAVSPILLVLFLWAMGWCAKRFRTDRDAAFLVLSFISLFGFYALVAFTRRANVNWPVAAYAAAAPALGWMWYARPRGRWARGWLVAGLALGAALGIGARSTDLLYVAGVPVNPDKDPTNKLRGGRELGAALAKHIDAGADAPFFFSDRYQLTAWAAFYTPGKPRVYCANLGDRRYNQYDLWDGWDGLTGRDGIFVTGGDDIRARWLIADMIFKGAFTSGEYLETVEVRRGGTLIRTYTISRLHGYTGRPWKPSHEKF